MGKCREGSWLEHLNREGSGQSRPDCTGKTAVHSKKTDRKEEINRDVKRGVAAVPDDRGRGQPPILNATRDKDNVCTSPARFLSEHTHLRLRSCMYR